MVDAGEADEIEEPVAGCSGEVWCFEDVEVKGLAVGLVYA